MMGNGCISKNQRKMAIDEKPGSRKRLLSRKLGKLQLQVRNWKFLAAIETSIEQDWCLRSDAYRGRSMLSTLVVKLKLC